MPLLTRLDALIRAHSRVVLGTWIAAVAVAIPFALHQSDRLTSGGFAVPGSDSAKVEAILAREYPTVSRATLAVLLWPGEGAVPLDLTQSIHRVEVALRGLSGIDLSRTAREQALFAVNLVGPTIIPLQVNVSQARAQSDAAVIADRLKRTDAGRTRIESYLLGEGALWAALNETSKKDLADAEKIGVPILLVVLWLIFGSLSAAILPLVLGAVAVVIAGAAIYFLSLAMELSVFTTNTASMLGVGVAVDYSLIILARVRQELQAGRELSDARQVALETSGRAVIFSGLTVIASLAGVWVIPNNSVRSMALGAVVVIAIAVLAAVTLLPALIGVLGATRLRTGVVTSLVKRIRTRSKGGVPTWERWTRAVMRHPIVAVCTAGGMLLVLCVPVLHLQTSTGALRQLEPHNSTRVGFSRAAEAEGAGALGPSYVVVHAASRASQRHLAQGTEALRRRSEESADVSQVGLAHISSDRAYAYFTVTPKSDPESAAAKRLVEQLRSALPGAVHVRGVSVLVGGTSANQLDEEKKVAGSMLRLIGVVLLLSFVVLATLVGSILLPLKAIVMNLLSVGAAYGVMVAVFQWGWLDALLNYNAPGHLDTLTPPLILAVVFGLSMDYEVFLLSRIKEHWIATDDARGAVAEGLAASAATISSAAFLLVCVFAIFIGTGVPEIKELGVGAAVAIGLDATLVRLVLVPAVMRLLGRWSWWLPPSMRTARAYIQSTKAGMRLSAAGVDKAQI
jgi:uncharacterized membrane protein YdfJ with MMPL/SSD domain